MCSCYELAAEPGDIAGRFGLTEVPPFLAAVETRPTDGALVIDGERNPMMLSWGIGAPWDGKPLINARAETVDQKKTFRPLLASRCLVDEI